MIKRLFLVFASMIFVFSLASLSVSASPKYHDNRTKYPNGTVFNTPKTYGFEVNWTEDVFENATFETNFTGTIVNYTQHLTSPESIRVANDTKDIFYINFTQEQFKEANIFYFKWYGNDTFGIENVTESVIYTIRKATPNVTQYFNPSPATYGSPYVIYPNFTIANGTSSYPEFRVYVNDILYDNSSGLVGYWKFDNTTASEKFAIDSSGNANQGELPSESDFPAEGNSTSGWNNTDCKFGNCLKFDGINDYVNMLNDSSLNFGTGDFSMGAWFKITELSRVQLIISKTHTSAPEIEFGINNINYPYSYIADLNWANDVTVTSPNAVVMGQWYYIVLTKTSSAANLYVDGNLMDSGDSSSIGNLDNTNNFTVGGNIVGDTYYFNGTIDEVRVWNRALSAGEIQKLFDFGNGTKAIGAGIWNITTNTTGNANYSTEQDSDVFIINKGVYPTNLTVNETSVEYGYTVNMTASATQDVETVIYTNFSGIFGNITPPTSGSNENITDSTQLTLRVYNVSANSTVGSNYTSNATLETTYFTVVDTTKPNITDVDMYPKVDSALSDIIMLNETISVVGNITDGYSVSSVWWSYALMSGGVCSDNNFNVSMNSVAGNHYRFREVSPTEDGIYCINVTANDTAGNENSTRVGTLSVTAHHGVVIHVAKSSATGDIPLHNIKVRLVKGGDRWIKETDDNGDAFFKATDFNLTEGKYTAEIGELPKKYYMPESQSIKWLQGNHTIVEFVLKTKPTPPVPMPAQLWWDLIENYEKSKSFVVGGVTDSLDSVSDYEYGLPILIFVITIALVAIAISYLKVSRHLKRKKLKT